LRAGLERRLQGNRTVVTDARAKKTTLTFSAGNNLLSEVDPSGKRTTYVWDGSWLKAFVNGRGKRFSFAYAALSHGTKGLSAIIMPLGAASASCTIPAIGSRPPSTSWATAPRSSGTP